jgi:DMSO/TMAO reductase YedYZ heme-binding membrane subunit
MVWGLVLGTRAALGRRAAPGALLSMHRFLGGLAVAFTAVHVMAILADTFVSFSVVDVLLPLASSWRPVPVALGIVGLYLLAAVEVTSLVRARLPTVIWREIHLLSYVLFALVTIHAITAGSDTRATLTEGLAFAIGGIAAFGAFGLWWNRSGAAEARAAGVPYDR